ncbi:MAG TPA: hypothetical protein VN929_05055 [Burkholderiales bacterium]|nr:hypothetical protein [Burkholderiales bacterium]
MLKRRTLQILVLIAALYALLLLPGVLWPGYFDTPAGYLIIAPLLSVYMFHRLGMPGLLEDGACGMALCPPSALGWIFIAALWVAGAWLVAWLMASIMNPWTRKR